MDNNYMVKEKLLFNMRSLIHNIQYITDYEMVQLLNGRDGEVTEDCLKEAVIRLYIDS